MSNFTSPLAALQNAKQSPVVEAVNEPTPDPFAQAQAQAVSVPTLPSSPPPTLEEGQAILCKLTPGKFDAFIKVLSLLDDKSIINITDSQICQSIQNNTAILKTNISQLVDNPNVNLHILSPKKYLSAFKAIKGNTDIYIIDDNFNSRFIVRSGGTKLWLPKQIDSFGQDIQPPDIQTMNQIGNGLTVHKEERNAIISLMKDTNNINLLVQQNQLKGFSIPEMLEAPFKMYEKEEISESKAELKLTSYAFLCIPTDSDSVVYLAKLEDQHWLITTINTAIIDITVLEPVNITEESLKL
jgi:hypothetical protein